MEKFKVELKRLRKSNNLTQKQLADELKLTNSTICDWECGRTEPNLDQLVLLCDFFDIPADYILGR